MDAYSLTRADMATVLDVDPSTVSRLVLGTSKFTTVRSQQLDMIERLREVLAGPTGRIRPMSRRDSLPAVAAESDDSPASSKHFYIVRIADDRASALDVVGSLHREIARAIDNELFSGSGRLFLEEIVLPQIERLFELIDYPVDESDHAATEAELRTRVAVLADTAENLKTSKFGPAAAIASKLNSTAVALSRFLSLF